MKVALFDMDGTLTPARQKMTQSMCRYLKKLIDNDIQVGIVTGSTMEYVIQQCEIIFSSFHLDYEKIDFFPCNGTQHYKFLNGASKPQKLNYLDMQGKLGVENYNNIIYFLCSLQSRLKYQLYSKSLPLTGNFIDCRGSMINWCPIGRNADASQREAWVNLDKKHNIRNNFLEQFFKNPIFEEITIKLGGETSFDIYPNGWDKTFVLNYFSDKDEIWFVGDKCEVNGNDKELYDAIKAIDSNRAHATKSVEDTQNIIKKYILKENHE